MTPTEDERFSQHTTTVKRLKFPQANFVKGWCKSSYDQTNSIFFIENFTIVVWKVAQGPTDMDQKHLTHSESLSFIIEATCLLLSSPRNFL